MAKMTRKYYSNTWTFTSNAARILTDQPLLFTELDIQILTNDALMGDVNGQSFELGAGDIVSYRNARGIDIRGFFFKNALADSNIKVVVSGITLE